MQAIGDSLRAWSLMLAFLLAAFALYLQHTPDEYERLTQQVRGVYQNSLLDAEVSPHALHTLTLTPEFRAAVGGRVTVEWGASDPSTLIVTTRTESKDELQVAHQRAVGLLSNKMRELTLAEISGALELVAKARATNEGLQAVHLQQTGSEKQDSSTTINTLLEREQELSQRVDEIAAAGELSLTDTLEYSVVSSYHFLLRVLCWVAALSCFLFALFRPTKTAPIKEIKKSKEVRSKPRTERRHLSLYIGQSHANRFDALFDRLYQEVERSLERPPRRLLVLGDESVDTRLEFSIRFADHLSKESFAVRLVDFDLLGKHLSQRLGREKLPGVGNVLHDGGPIDEFFSSIAGSKVQFAPAGTLAKLEIEIEPERLAELLEPGDGVVVVDACSSAPLHLVVYHVDAVLYTSHPHAKFNGPTLREREVLGAFREAGLPIWEVHVNEGSFDLLL